MLLLQYTWNEGENNTIEGQRYYHTRRGTTQRRVVQHTKWYYTKICLYPNKPEQFRQDTRLGSISLFHDIEVDNIHNLIGNEIF
jgi:hypothetical protein